MVRKVKKVFSFPSLLAAAATNTASDGWANLTLSFKNGKCAAAPPPPPSTAAMACHPKAGRKTWRQKSAPARTLVSSRGRNEDLGEAVAGGDVARAPAPANSARRPLDPVEPLRSRDLLRVKQQDGLGGPGRLKRASSSEKIFSAFVSVCETVRSACSPRSSSSATRKKPALSGC